MTPAEKVHEIFDSLRHQHDYIGDTYRMSVRLERKFRRREGEVLPIYLAVVGTVRCYGGPEEGGWWYDWSDIEEVRKAWDWKTALQYARELKEDYPQPRFGIGSCANNGEAEYSIVVCSHPSFYESHQTTQRPTYW